MSPRPARGWIGGPTGLCFHDGYYHVFFQHSPGHTEQRGVHWGHFRSRDLLRWELLPPALAPTPGGADAEGCWSGSATGPDDRMLAFYSAYRGDRWWQPVCSAESSDGGLTWYKGDLPVIPDPPPGTTMFRDPYVWWSQDRWRMLVGAALTDGRSAVLLYESEDLEQWWYRRPFLARAPESLAGNTERGWERPQYVPELGLLVLGVWDADRGSSRAVAYTEWDGSFSGDAPTVLDHGPDCSASALLPAPDGRWLLWAWTCEARDAAWVREAGWAGALTVPREVTVEGGLVRQRPARELLDLRARRPVGTTVEPGDWVELGEVSRSFDLSLEQHGAVVLRLVTGECEFLEISANPAEVLVDRSHACTDPRATGGSYRVVRTEPDNTAEPGGTLRILVDHSLVEIYLASGEVLTLRCYPTGDPPWRLLARASDAAAAVQAYDLAPVTPGTGSARCPRSAHWPGPC